MPRKRKRQPAWPAAAYQHALTTNGFGISSGVLPYFHAAINGEFMIEIVDALLKYINTNSWLGVGGIVIGVLAYRIQLQAIVDFFDRRDTKKEKYIKDALKIKSLDAATRSLLEEEFNRVICSKVTGISGNGVYRQKMHELIDNSNGRIGKNQLSRAQQYVKLIDDKLVVEMKTDAKGAYYLGLFGVAVFVLLSMMFFGLLVLSKGAPTLQGVYVFSLGVLTFAGALVLQRLNAPFLAAKKIAPLIVKLQQVAESAPSLDPARTISSSEPRIVTRQGVR